MADQPTNPEDCYGTSLWGFGQWPFDGTNDDIRAWAYTNALIPNSPIVVALANPHPDHDAGLEPDPAKFHPIVAPSSASIDVTNPITEEEWGLLVGEGVLETAWSAPGPNLITAVDLTVGWSTAQMGAGYPVAVGSCPAHPAGSGYGGEGYGPQGEGGTGYGLGSFGAVWHAAPEFPVDGGYGGDPYGFGSYGGSEVIPPSLSSAVSLTGWEIEVFFNEEMDPDDAELLNAANYTLAPAGGLGGPSTVTAVRIEKLGTIDITAGDFIAGVSSVVITHTGTTLGGTYTVSASGMSDVAGNVIITATVSLLTKGEPPAYTVTPQGGNQLLFTFAQDMLESTSYHGGAVETILDTASYAFASSPTYPVSLAVTGVEHPYNGNLNEALLTVVGQTSLTYTPRISPSLVTGWGGDTDPNSLAGGFAGADVGVTFSATLSNSKYIITQSGTGSSYVLFEDQTGFIVAGSSYRTDLTFDASSSFTKPVGVVVSQILVHQLHDGAVEHNVYFGWDGTTNEPNITLNLGNGAPTVVLTSYDWTDTTHTISMVRNQKAGIVTFLWDGAPVYSDLIANQAASAAPWQVGTRSRVVTSAPVPVVSGMKLHSNLTTASSTVFSGAWNFLHEVLGNAFVGNIANTRDTVRVARGPLVKGWGDATPATKADVAVIVNGTSVDIDSVNPYLGEITTVIPVPLMPLGMSDVKVDYQWMSSPVMEFAGLNTDGLVLNKFDCTHGHHDPAAHGDQVQDANNPKGAPDLSRFPMGLVLGPVDRPEPLFIGHRYMGFQREYSAVLNSPTTMLLNQHPNRSIKDGFESTPIGETVTFEGLVRPTGDDPVWVSEGTDSGGVVYNDAGAPGIYRIVDAQDSSYDPNNPSAAFYWRDVDLSFPSTMYVVGRFNVTRDDTLSPDGVFTGVGMGVHDGRHLYLMGCLLVNDVEHVALLIDANKPSLVTSWLLGPQAQLSLQSESTAKALTSQVPSDLKAGDRFQIFYGDGVTDTAHPQTGVFTLTSVVFQTDGTVTLTVDGDWPAHWNTYGNRYPIAVFEVQWATPEVITTFRLTVDPEQRYATLQAPGSTTTNIAILDGSVTMLPQPAESSLLLPAPLDAQKGQAFFGSLSREGKNESYWTFFRYGVVPDVTSVAGHEVVVEAEMGEVPEQDPNHDWALLGNFGYSEVDSTADAVLLKQTSADDVRDFAFGYARNETWFAPDSNFDLSAKFRVETGSGVQDAQVIINDTLREARLGTLMYGENFVGGPNPAPTTAAVNEARFLIRVPDVSFKGLRLPEDQSGWAKASFTGFDDPTFDFLEGCLSAAQASGQKYAVTGTVLDNGLNFTDRYGRVLEARFAVKAHQSAGDGFTGIRMLGTFDHHLEGAGHALREAGLHLYDGGVRVISNGDNSHNELIQDYAFDWDDGELHTYRMVLDAENAVVMVYLDDTLQLPTLTAASFTNGDNPANLSWGQFAVDGTGADDLTVTSTVEWRSASFQALPENSVHRTLGVFRGTDIDAINDWELPRTDSSNQPNSSQFNVVIEDMDWRDWMEVRLWRDPTWGITVLRPDLPLPPYYLPEDPNNPGTGFATELTEPSAGWINVEYAQLPRIETTFGQVRFGSLRRDNVTQQRWEWMRYRLFRSATDDINVPQGMVLNRHNVITSGELTEGKGHETVSVQTLDDRRLTLLPTHLFAERVWKVVEGSTVYTAEMFDFKRESQLLSLLPDEAGEPRCFGQRTQGTTGVFTEKGSTFSDVSADFSAVVAGDLLKIRFGEAAGSYQILAVEPTAKALTVKGYFPANPAGGAASWSITQARVPVTVVFVPGKPVTNTYLLNQPLLDGITKLNEGTPPVPKSLVAGVVRQEVFGSQVNNPNDLLNNDPNFVLNDPYRVVEFEDDADALYEQMDFMTVDNGGEEGVISFPCEATGLSDTPGFFDTTVGDPIYEAGGAGAALAGVGDSAGLTETGSLTGEPSGAHLLHFSGSSFWEGVGALVSTHGSRVVHNVEQGGGMPGALFFASGGNYHGPSVGGGPRNALGGNLGPGTTTFYPVYPSLPARQGGGKIYRRTEWFMRFREMSVGIDGGGDVIGQALDETLTMSGNDNTPPSGPSDWTDNPDGAAAGNGSAIAVLSGSEDFSHYGPWGGVGALSAAKDSGDFVFIEAPLTIGTVLTITLPGPVDYLFTAAAVPVGTDQFLNTPNPGVELAQVINDHPLVGLSVRATAGFNMAGEEVVRVEALSPVTTSNTISLATSHSARVSLANVSATNTLTGGSKILQSSMLAGGAATLDEDGIHDPELGMIALGGSALPTGVVQELVLVSA